ncbi:hypothetical protein F2Q69_00017672 [Brassica cretica]|uniref:Uncharacterized protein n=2 Tax=Brassica cretica TaxID=69181 RepID=A0A8S9R2H8_BRACR|nr:hypothetical protein F2Q69_00017672 [Brassica cretica]KAF3581636.1 hypothetical protein DY000_02035652 [Brassica cretica]
MRAGSRPRFGGSLQLHTGLPPRFVLVAPALESCRREVEFRAGDEGRCNASLCLRFFWRGCRRSLLLPAPVLYSPK